MNSDDERYLREAGVKEGPKVPTGTLLYCAPAAVRIKVNNGKGEALLREGDTMTLEFDGSRPERLTLEFDWNVEAADFATCWKINKRLGGDVNMFF